MKKETKEVRFSKSELLKAKAYKGRTDFLNALLDDSTMYTHEEVEKIIKDFCEREVN